MRALCADFAGCDGQILAHFARDLDDEVRAKYVAAMALGPLEVLRIVEAAIASVVTTPLEHPNMCAAPAKRRRDGAGAGAPPTLKVDCKNPAHHNAVRFTIYIVLKEKFGFGGGAVSRSPRWQSCSSRSHSPAPRPPRSRGLSPPRRRSPRARLARSAGATTLTPTLSDV